MLVQTEKSKDGIRLSDTHAPLLMPKSLEDFGIQPRDLKYRGEGNLTLVASLEMTRNILRFRKICRADGADQICETKQQVNSDSKCNCHIRSPHCCSCYEVCLDRIAKMGSRQFHQLPRSLNLTSVYTETVMKPLLGGQLVPLVEVLHADPETLRTINSLMHPYRSDHRLVKQIDINHHEVILTSDVAFLPQEIGQFVLPGSKTLCVEIKPKQGFILKSLLEKSRWYCFYCRNQLCRRINKPKSNYCPCDLFSGKKSRMMRALESLVETPQNNLQVFMDGHLTYHSGSTTDSLNSCLMECFPSSTVSSESFAVKSFLEIIYQTLTFEFPVSASNATSDFKYPDDVHYTQQCARQTDANRESGTAASAASESQSTMLNPNCVLGRIFSVQLLDKLGVDGTLSHYNRLDTFLQENATSWDFSKGSLAEFVESLNAPKSVAQSAQHCSDYLTSLVAKDCSIMIALAPSCPRASQLPPLMPHHVTDPVTGMEILFSIAVVDLDPKPFDRVKQHWEESRTSLTVLHDLLNKQSI